MHRHLINYAPWVHCVRSALTMFTLRHASNLICDVRVTGHGLIFRGLRTSCGASLTAIEHTFMGIKRLFDFVFRIVLRDFGGFKLGITGFADTDCWKRRLYDSELTFLHHWAKCDIT